MSKLSFRDLFKRETLEREQVSAPRPDDIREQPFIPGDPFPDFELDSRLADSEQAVILFVSLTCSSCIDLLPELGSFSDRFDGLLVLVSSGLQEENEELARYYDYPFAVHTMEENIYKAKFGLEATPAAILLEKGLMTQRFTIQHIGHLYEQSGIQKNRT
ncbi:TlpA family protein disulfide reductase [Paenibacillus paeoniae]|uniref:Thioredoxin family protein n=1 Tax=Paenibacillus paeoniae TaxID=2292705 RepID=A0A371PLR1_9BACL|nr:thioredoxin family protein [Paenibacillus paeoniae]REK77136.1 thioredoxin family protein [Paenibacillus paeoniae]